MEGWLLAAETRVPLPFVFIKNIKIVSINNILIIPLNFLKI